MSSPAARDALRREYIARVNRVIDYVWANFGKELRPTELADLACFSRFHFHRIFAAMTGETLNDFIRRVRLERAASMLISDPVTPITNIALDCGFSSSSVFARAFKDRFGMSASAWRDGGWIHHRKDRRVDGNSVQALSKESQANSSDGEAPARDSFYLHGTPQQQRRFPVSKLEFKAEVKELPELNVAYVRHVGPYNQIGQAFGRLMKWAGPRGLAQAPGVRFVAVYHEDPEVTDTDQLRSSACVTVPKGTAVGGEIGALVVPGGLFAVGHFEIDGTQFQEAWDALLSGWLPDSGYQPDNRMCYELYLNDHDTHPQKKFIVDICEPVKPL